MVTGRHPLKPVRTTGALEPQRSVGHQAWPVPAGLVLPRPQRGRPKQVVPGGDSSPPYSPLQEQVTMGLPGADGGF